MIKVKNFEEFELRNKRVFVRLDLDVPMEGKKIADDTKLQKALPTVQSILKDTNKIVLAGCLSARGEDGKPLSLIHVAQKLAELLGKEIVFIDDYCSESVAQVLNQLDRNQIVLLENLLFHEEENDNDVDFASKLCPSLEYYINDDFSSLFHIKSSTVGIARHFIESKMAIGALAKSEIDNLDKLLHSDKFPFTLVVGGKKLSNKFAMILNVMNYCSQVLIGGSISYYFLKYKGFVMAKDDVEEGMMEYVKAIYELAESRGIKLLLPTDHLVVQNQDSKDAEVVLNDHIKVDHYGKDIGPRTIRTYSECLENSKKILWIGEMGCCSEGFDKGTEAIIAAMGKSDAETVVAGDGSIKELRKLNASGKVSHLSMGGQTSLEFLAGKNMPGLRVLQIN